MIDLLIELASVSLSWRFWLPIAIALAAAYALRGSFSGWLPAALLVCGTIAGIVWSSARRPKG